MCDYEIPDFYTLKIVTIRKQHRCCECGDRFEPSTRMEKVNAKWDGTVKSLYTCSACVGVRQACINRKIFDCWAHGEIHEDLYASGLLFYEDDAAEGAHCPIATELPWLWWQNGKLTVVGKYQEAIEAARFAHKNFDYLETAWGL